MVDLNVKGDLETKDEPIKLEVGYIIERPLIGAYIFQISVIFIIVVLKLRFELLV